MREGDRTLKVSLPISVSLDIRFVILHMHVSNFVHVQGTLVSLKLTSRVSSLMGDKLLVISSPAD